MVNKEEALQLIDAKLSQARALMDECVFIAEEANVMFCLPWGGEGTGEAGMGACYIPTGADEKTINWNSNDGSTGWQSSAGSC